LLQSKEVRLDIVGGSRTPIVSILSLRELCFFFNKLRVMIV